MLGINVKRGVATTLERVLNSSGDRFNKLEVFWNGTTAGINFKRSKNRIDAKFIFPSIDETKTIPNDVFNNLIGYSLHELGHAWYTDNEPWDFVRDTQVKFVNNLVNGLEDPRIEQLVIDSGRAPNSRALFENLLNSILNRDGYVSGKDKKNIPFLLAVEGRRLNGYNINVRSIVDDSPYAVHLHWALQSARIAKNTQRIADIAVELYNRIKEQDKQRNQEEQEEQDDGNPTNPSDKPSDKPTNPSDEQGDEEGGEDGDEEGGNKPSNKPSNEQGEEEGEQEDGNGSGHGDEGFDGGRDVEPSTFIEGELGKHSSTVDKDAPRPSFGKPRFETFNWR